MGQWGPASLSFQDVRVPHSAILGEEGRGFELAMRWIGRGRYLLPARALGALQQLACIGHRATFELLATACQLPRGTVCAGSAPGIGR